jgi:hypothetical protein
MQKQTHQSTLTRTKVLPVHGVLGRRSMHRRLAVAAVGALLLIGVRALKRNMAGSGLGESP